ncbi:MAG: dihydroorotase [Lachnospiraceae bacterium]|nr:dihydroorotase [Lachnospiraceae bacterium]
MLLIHNGYVIAPDSGREGMADILIKDDKIIAVLSNGEDPLQFGQITESIDAAGLCVGPGLVDVHVHFRDPGFTYKEDIFTGAEGAARGGYTSVVMMANTNPTIDTAETLRQVLEKGRQTNLNVYACAGVSKGLSGQEPCDYEALLRAGAAGFTDDGVPVMKESLLRAVMEFSARRQIPVSLHEEDPSLITNNGIHRGRASAYYGLEGSPREAEISLVKRDLKMACHTGAIVNIQHISCKETVELLRQAKAAGYHNIHGEATPHHFTLTEEDVIAKGTLAKMNPPLRTAEDRAAIREGLLDGTLDIIATDHAPHSREEKAKPITEAPSGILGLETAFALAITELGDKEGMSLTEIFRRMSLAPARLYGLQAGFLKAGGPADLILFDPKETWKVREFASKSSNSPFLDTVLKGKIKTTICGGKVIFSSP